jgi:hypothetical protein
MRQTILLIVLLLSFAISASGQGEKNRAGDGSADDREIKRLSLLSDIQFLASDSSNLNNPLARAAAQAEIADAAWALDSAWAKKLLREAFELTLPPEEEQAKLRARPVGAQPIFPSSEGRARASLRRRILSIANRDKTFADELTQLGAQKLGKHEEQLGYVDLADQAIVGGDLAAASDYIRKAMVIDPSQTSVVNAINEIAKKDRAAADRIILQYFALLRNFHLTADNQSIVRAMFTMSMLITPQRYSMIPSQKGVPPPEPAVVRAYISYVLDYVRGQDPGQMQTSRLWLLSVWDLLKQYAPDLTEPFLELELLTRGPGAEPLPKTSLADAYKEKYQKQSQEALEKEQADERDINAAISNADFGKARKLIDKLADGPQKRQFLEAVNTREALSLAGKGDAVGAERLAGQLNTAASILQVYPILTEKCIGRKDQPCASRLVSQAVRQLKQADTTPAKPPPGMPASVIAGAKEADPVLISLSRLAKQILQLDETLALEVLDEMVAAANRSEIATEMGRTGFEAEVFKTFAAKDEARSLLAAQTLKDRLSRIVSLAAIYKFKAEKLKPQAVKPN